MAVAIPGDSGISEEDHAAVVYDQRSNQFLLRPGSGPPALRNGEAVRTSIRLEAGDQITVGKTTLVFIPLAGEEFRW